MYTSFTIIFSSCFSKVTIGYNPTRVMALAQRGRRSAAPIRSHANPMAGWRAGTLRDGRAKGAARLGPHAPAPWISSPASDRSRPSCSASTETWGVGRARIIRRASAIFRSYSRPSVTAKRVEQQLAARRSHLSWRWCSRPTAPSIFQMHGSPRAGHGPQTGPPRPRPRRRPGCSTRRCSTPGGVFSTAYGLCGSTKG